MSKKCLITHRKLEQIKGVIIMAEGKEMFLGLNKNGLILFIVLIIVCLPLCWIPWLVNSCKAANEME